MKAAGQTMLAAMLARGAAAAGDFLRGFLGLGADAGASRASECGHATATAADIKAGLEARASRRRSCC